MDETYINYYLNIRQKYSENSFREKILNNLAQFLTHQKEYKEAEELYLEVLCG
jgi:Tetratricopeptide repeat